MIALFLKCTLILLAAMLGCYLLRKQAAAGRRLVWLAGLSATPEKQRHFRLNAPRTRIVS